MSRSGRKTPNDPKEVVAKILLAVTKAGQAFREAEGIKPAHFDVLLDLLVQTQMQILQFKRAPPTN